MTEEEVLSTIMLVCNRVKNKYKAGIHDADDIYQEAFCECVRAMDRYDSRAPLENFLMVNARNRLHNFRRNVNNREILTVNFGMDDEPSYELEQDRLKAFEQLIEEKLSVDMRHDYLKLRDGVKIPRIRRKKLYEELKRLADDFGE